MHSPKYNFWYLNANSLKCIPCGPIHDTSVLVDVTAWCCQATSHNLNQCLPRPFMWRPMSSLGNNELTDITTDNSTDLFTINTLVKKWIDLLRKSRNAPVLYHTTHRFVASVTKRCIVGYLFDAPKMANFLKRTFSISWVGNCCVLSQIDSKSAFR